MLLHIMILQLISIKDWWFFSCLPIYFSFFRNPIDIKLSFGTHVIITDLKDETDVKAIPCPQIHHYRKVTEEVLGIQ